MLNGFTEVTIIVLDFWDFGEIELPQLISNVSIFLTLAILQSVNIISANLRGVSSFC